MKNIFITAMIMFLSTYANAKCFYASEDEICPNNQKIAEFVSSVDAYQESNNILVDHLCYTTHDKTTCTMFYRRINSSPDNSSCTLHYKNPLSYSYFQHGTIDKKVYNQSIGFGFKADAEQCRKKIKVEEWDYIKSKDEIEQDAINKKRLEESKEKTEDDYAKEYREMMEKRKNKAY